MFTKMSRLLVLSVALLSVSMPAFAADKAAATDTTVSTKKSAMKSHHKKAAAKTEEKKAESPK